MQFGWEVGNIPFSLSDVGPSESREEREEIFCCLLMMELFWVVFSHIVWSWSPSVVATGSSSLEGIVLWPVWSRVHSGWNFHTEMWWKGGSGNETRMGYLSTVIATVLLKYFKTCKPISFNHMLACQLKGQEGLPVWCVVFTVTLAEREVNLECCLDMELRTLKLLDKLIFPLHIWL